MLAACRALTVDACVPGCGWWLLFPYIPWREVEAAGANVVDELVETMDTAELGRVEVLSVEMPSLGKAWLDIAVVILTGEGLNPALSGMIPELPRTLQAAPILGIVRS